MCARRKEARGHGFCACQNSFARTQTVQYACAHVLACAHRNGASLIGSGAQTANACVLCVYGSACRYVCSHLRETSSDMPSPATVRIYVALNPTSSISIAFGTGFGPMSPVLQNSNKSFRRRLRRQRGRAFSSRIAAFRVCAQPSDSHDTHHTRQCVCVCLLSVSPITIEQQKKQTQHAPDTIALDTHTHIHIIGMVLIKWAPLRSTHTRVHAHTLEMRASSLTERRVFRMKSFGPHGGGGIEECTSPLGVI